MVDSNVPLDFAKAKNNFKILLRNYIKLKNPTTTEENLETQLIDIYYTNSIAVFDNIVNSIDFSRLIIRN